MIICNWRLLGSGLRIVHAVSVAIFEQSTERRMPFSRLSDRWPTIGSSSRHSVTAHRFCILFSNIWRIFVVGLVQLVYMCIVIPSPMFCVWDGFVKCIEGDCACDAFDDETELTMACLRFEPLISEEIWQCTSEQRSPIQPFKVARKSATTTCLQEQSSFCPLNWS